MCFKFGGSMSYGPVPDLFLATSGRVTGEVAFAKPGWVPARGLCMARRELDGAPGTPVGASRGVSRTRGIWEARTSTPLGYKGRPPFFSSTLPGVFEGWCHQVLQSTCQNGLQQSPRSLFVNLYEGF